MFKFNIYETNLLPIIVKKTDISHSLNFIFVVKFRA